MVLNMSPESVSVLWTVFPDGLGNWLALPESPPVNRGGNCMMSEPEIAKILGLSRSTVHTYIRRGLAKLRRLMSPPYPTLAAEQRVDCIARAALKSEKP
jgi:IS30 family transposase